MVNAIMMFSILMMGAVVGYMIGLKHGVDKYDEHIRQNYTVTKK